MPEKQTELPFLLSLCAMALVMLVSTPQAPAANGRFAGAAGQNRRLFKAAGSTEEPQSVELAPGELLEARSRCHQPAVNPVCH